MKLFRRLAFFILACSLALTIGFVIRAPRAEAVTASPAADPVAVLQASAAAVPFPPPAQDTCQHCHLTGEITALFYQFTRWMVFGLFGVVFGYGVWRLGSKWTTRTPWKPLLARAVDWTEERFHLKEPLGKVLSKPVPLFATRWYYCLGGLSFALFAIQGITGIMLTFYYQPTPEGAYASIQYIENEVLFGSSVRAIRSSTSACCRCAARCSALSSGATPPTAWFRSTFGFRPGAAPWSCPAPTPAARR